MFELIVANGGWWVIVVYNWLATCILPFYSGPYFLKFFYNILLNASYRYIYDTHVHKSSY